MKHDKYLCWGSQCTCECEICVNLKKEADDE